MNADEIVFSEGGMADSLRVTIESAQSAAWLEGMHHALTWLGLKQYADVMAKDNPHGKVGE